MSTQARFDTNARSFSTHKIHPKKKPSRKSSARPTVYGYYVGHREIYEQKWRNSAGDDDLFQPFRDFRTKLCRETGLPDNHRTFCEVGGDGYCIVLARNLSRKAPRTPQLNTLIQKVKDLLETQEEPRWYHEVPDGI